MDVEQKGIEVGKEGLGLSTVSTAWMYFYHII